MEPHTTRAELKIRRVAIFSSVTEMQFLQRSTASSSVPAERFPTVAIDFRASRIKSPCPRRVDCPFHIHRARKGRFPLPEAGRILIVDLAEPYCVDLPFIGPILATIERESKQMNRTFQRNPRVEAAPLNEEAILLDPATSKFFMLNSTSSFIWERLSMPATADSLAGEICKSFDKIAMPDALNDVRAALDEMLSMELVVANDAP